MAYRQPVSPWWLTCVWKYTKQVRQPLSSLSLTTTVLALRPMAPFPSSSPQAPASPVVPFSAAQPSEPTLADLLRTSPGLFWLLIGAFSLIMTLGITWVVISWRRYAKRGGLLKDRQQEGAPRVGRVRRYWFWRQKTVADEGGLAREIHICQTKTSEPDGAEDEKVDLGPFISGWTPPVRKSSLAHLSYYSNATFVPPHEHGLPLSSIQEESESNISSGTGGGLRSSGAYETSSDLSLPSIVVDTSTSSASLSSLAYLSTTSSPLTAFIESLEAFPRVPLAFPNLPSPCHLQVPNTARTRHRGDVSSASEGKHRQNPDSRMSAAQSTPNFRKSNGQGKENVAPYYAENDSRKPRGTLKELSHSRKAPTSIHRSPLATVSLAGTSDAF